MWVRPFIFILSIPCCVHQIWSFRKYLKRYLRIDNAFTYTWIIWKTLKNSWFQGSSHLEAQTQCAKSIKWQLLVFNFLFLFMGQICLCVLLLRVSKYVRFGEDPYVRFYMSTFKRMFHQDLKMFDEYLRTCVLWRQQEIPVAHSSVEDV